eukprot:2473897-Rhodomonas_salina.3
MPSPSRMAVWTKRTAMPKPAANDKNRTALRGRASTAHARPLLVSEDPAGARSRFPAVLSRALTPFMYIIPASNASRQNTTERARIIFPSPRCASAGSNQASSPGTSRMSRVAPNVLCVQHNPMSTSTEAHRFEAQISVESGRTARGQGRAELETQSRGYRGRSRESVCV